MAEGDPEEYPLAPAQKARDANILGVFEDCEDPVVTTSEVAAELPIGKRATLNRLEDLVDRGVLDSKDVGVGRVWWLVEPETEPADASEEGADNHEPTPAEPPVAEDGPARGRAEPLEPERPRWAFIGSLGRHSIYAGVFLIVLLWTESQTAQQLVPVGATRLFLTSVVFFLIGFPAYAVYRVKQYLVRIDLSPSQVLGPLAGAED